MNGYKISPGGKLSGRRGESIGETLAALLVSAMGLLILAQMIGAGAKMTKESKLLYDAYYSSDAALSSSDVGENAELKLLNRATSSDIQLYDGSPIVVTYRKNTNATNVPDRDRPVSYTLYTPSSSETGP